MEVWHLKYLALAESKARWAVPFMDVFFVTCSGLSCLHLSRTVSIKPIPTTNLAYFGIYNPFSIISILYNNIFQLQLYAVQSGSLNSRNIMQWALSAYRMLKVTRVQTKCWIIFPFSLATADWSISITVLLWLTDFSCVYCNLLNCRHIIAKCSRWHCHTMARQWSCNKFWGTSDNMWQLWHQYRWLTRQRWISYDIFALEHKLANQAHVQLASNSRFSCSAPSHLGIFRCCNAFSCACNRVRVFVCVYPAQYALITCECHVPSITFPYHQHWHKGNALYYMVRDIREATVAPLRRMKAMKAANQRYPKGIAADTKCLHLRSIGHQAE